jgi:hypothetical protein
MGREAILLQAAPLHIKRILHIKWSDLRENDLNGPGTARLGWTVGPPVGGVLYLHGRVVQSGGRVVQTPLSIFHW